MVRRQPQDAIERFTYSLFHSKRCTDSSFSPEEWESFYCSAVYEGLAPLVYLKMRDAAFFPPEPVA